jgi:hypothetical protein
MINMTWFIKSNHIRFKFEEKKQKLEILDAIFDVSNEVEDIMSHPDDMFNDL